MCDNLPDNGIVCKPGQTHNDKVIEFLKLLDANQGKPSAESEEFKRLHLGSPRDSILARGVELLCESNDEILRELEDVLLLQSWRAIAS